MSPGCSILTINSFYESINLINVTLFNERTLCMQKMSENLILVFLIELLHESSGRMCARLFGNIKKLHPCELLK